MLHNFGRVIKPSHMLMNIVQRSRYSGRIRCHFSSNTSDSFVPHDLQTTLKYLDSDTRKNHNGNIDVKICNLCDKGNKSNLDNQYKLSIFKY